MDPIYMVTYKLPNDSEIRVAHHNHKDDAMKQATNLVKIHNYEGGELHSTKTLLPGTIDYWRDGKYFVRMCRVEISDLEELPY